MPESAIPKLEMEFIVDQIHQSRCVPFLGAAANVGSATRGYCGLPLGTDLAKEFASKVEFSAGGPNLARLALEYEVRTDRAYLLKFLIEFLAEQSREPSTALTTLAKLKRLKLIVTTNYDCLLERALDVAGRTYERVVQPTTGFDDSPKTAQLFEALESSKELIVYKIHGSFLAKSTPPVQRSGSQDVNGVEDLLEPSEPPSLIITEDDYIEFLTIVGKEHDKIGVPRVITKYITPSTLLFLGYSLEDWDFRTIYKSLIEPLHRFHTRKSFAIQKNPPPFWVDFWLKNNVKIFDDELYDFTERLEQVYAERYGLEDEVTRD
jgi:SIR2-like domain